MKTTKSQQLIIDVAKKLFWKYGMRKVTVEDICKEASISKMTFYRNFKNKTAVAKELIDQMVEKSRANYATIMEKDTSFRSRLLEAIAYKHEQAKEYSEEFLNDIIENKDPELSSHIEQIRMASLRDFERDMIDAQQKGWINPELKIPFIMYMVNDINTKLSDQYLLSLYESKQALIKELTNFFFFGILTQSENDENK